MNIWFTEVYIIPFFIIEKLYYTCCGFSHKSGLINLAHYYLYEENYQEQKFELKNIDHLLHLYHITSIIIFYNPGDVPEGEGNIQNIETFGKSPTIPTTTQLHEYGVRFWKKILNEGKSHAILMTFSISFILKMVS